MSVDAIGDLEELCERLEHRYATPHGDHKLVAEAVVMMRRLTKGRSANEFMSEDLAHEAAASIEKLCERLDDVAADMGLENASSLMAEAAAMLRSLAAEHKEDVHSNLKLQDEIASLRAKLERAREGLGSIACFGASHDLATKQIEGNIAKMARATLEEIK